MKKITLIIVMLITILSSNAQVFNDINKKLNVNPFSPFISFASSGSEARINKPVEVDNIDSVWSSFGIGIGVMAQDKLWKNLNIGIGIDVLLMSDNIKDGFASSTHIFIPIEVNYEFDRLIPFITIGPLFNFQNIDLGYKAGFRIIVAEENNFGTGTKKGNFDVYFNINYLRLHTLNYEDNCIQIGLGLLF